MVSSANSVPPNISDVTGVTPDRKFQVVPGNLPLDMRKCSENDRYVVGTCDDNDTMLRRPDQLLLTAENDHFEGSSHLKVEDRTNLRMGEGGVIFQSRLCTFLRLQMGDTFKVMVLRRQEELVGPPRHSIIGITCPHDFSAIFGAIEQL